jgi:hypothetical protein
MVPAPAGFPGSRAAGAALGARGHPAMTRARTSLIALAFGALTAASHVHAADPAQASFTPLKAPDCLTDVASTFFADDGQAPNGIALPRDRYFLVARHMGANAVAAAPAFDYSRFPDDYGWLAVRGHGLTGLAVPEPKPLWQRAARADATVDNASAFAVHCRDAGSFINSWTFPSASVAGGGPHVIFGYAFSQPPPMFDALPGTDFVLQAGIEIPWFAAWPDTGPDATYAPVGQVAFYVYARDRVSGKPFALIVAIFDNRAGTDGTYAPVVEHDGQTPFASTPLNRDAAYAHLSPYSASYTGSTWTGLRFFRVHVSQSDFRRALAEINAFCAAAPAAPFCASDPRIGAAYSSDPVNYELTDFGVIHEIFRGGPHGNISMGMHLFDLGAWNAR